MEYQVNIPYRFHNRTLSHKVIFSVNCSLIQFHVKFICNVYNIYTYLLYIKLSCRGDRYWTSPKQADRFSRHFLRTFSLRDYRYFSDDLIDTNTYYSPLFVAIAMYLLKNNNEREILGQLKNARKKSKKIIILIKICAEERK
jgi:hypothetical protein